MRKGITSKGLISIMMINKVEICGVNTAKLPVLKEKEMKELIRGVESATKLLDSMHRASGWTVVYRHGYIDENGKYCKVF